jgi:beta-glucosidase
VLRGLLRRELGFTGLVVTDALVMEAIAGRYGAGEAAVLALEAGADLVLMPADACAAINAIAAAVAEGRLQRERLEASVVRRRAALASLPQQGSTAADPCQAAAPDPGLARELVTATLELRGRIQPPPRGRPGVNLIRIDQALQAPFLPATAPAISIAAAARFRACLLASDTISPWSGDPQAPLALERLGQGPVLVQLFVRGNPFRGHAGGDEPWPAALAQLLTAGRLAGLVVYGSPYLWDELRELLPPGLPAGHSPGQMALAQAEVLAGLGLGTAAPEGAESGTAAGFTD